MRDTMEQAQSKRNKAKREAAYEVLEQRVAERTIELNNLNERLQQKLAEYKRIDEALTQSEEKFRAIFEYAPVMIASFDRNGLCVLWNTECEKQLGYTKDEVLKNSDPLLLVYPDDEIRSQVRQAIASRDGKFREFRARAKDGTDRYQMWANFALPNEDLISIGYDITESKKVEEALRTAKAGAEKASRAKNIFLSRMSHELRTPLNAILGFAQLLEMSDPSPADGESLGHIIRGGRHLLDLINEILDISRIETGRFALSPEPMSSRDAVMECLDLVQPMAKQRNIEMAIDKSWDRDIYIVADRQRLKQVMLNLLANAIKYNRSGGCVSLTCLMPGQGRLRMIVSDTGPGIASENLGKLFTPFERLGAEQTGVEGTGLGLALSRRLIEAMNGTIGVNSTVGVGSRFWVDLPVVANEAENPKVIEFYATRPSGGARRYIARQNAYSALYRGQYIQFQAG